MRRRRLLVGAALLALLGLAWWLLLVLFPPPGAGVTRANYERIKVGMMEADVEDILGCPAGNYSGKTPDWLNAHKRQNEADERMLKIHIGATHDRLYHYKAELAETQALLKAAEPSDQEHLKRQIKIQAELLKRTEDMNEKLRPKAVARLWVGEGLAVLIYFEEGRVASHHREFLDPTVPWEDRLRRLLPW
jgi:hypothetical protein